MMARKRIKFNRWWIELDIQGVLKLFFPLIINSFHQIMINSLFKVVTWKELKKFWNGKANEEEIMFKTPCMSSTIHQSLKFVLFLAIILTENLAHKCVFCT